MIRRMLFTSALAVLALIVRPAETHACSCAGRAASPSSVRGATAVFVGTVAAVEGRTGSGPVFNTFSKLKVYKGGVADPAIVETSRFCDIPFAEGGTYLVYAHALHPAGPLMTDSCKRTRAVETAGEDIRYLDNLAGGRPQGVIHGDVFRAIVGKDGQPAMRALFETLDVVVEGAAGRRSVPIERLGSYQLVLAPGEYRVWVEQAGRRVSAAKHITVAADEEERVQITANY